MSETAPPTAAAVLDAQALAGLSTLDPTGANRLVHRVLSTYHVSLDRLLRQIADARERHDHAGLRLAVHTLKSSSASVGALDLSRRCAEVEQALRDGRLDVVPDLTDGLQHEAHRVATTVGRMLAP